MLANMFKPRTVATAMLLSGYQPVASVEPVQPPPSAPDASPDAPAVPPTHAALVDLAEAWARDAGMSIEWYGTQASIEVLTHHNAVTRALWRCTLQLLHVAAEMAGLTVEQIVAAHVEAKKAGAA